MSYSNSLLLIWFRRTFTSIASVTISLDGSFFGISTLFAKSLRLAKMSLVWLIWKKKVFSVHSRDCMHILYSALTIFEFCSCWEGIEFDLIKLLIVFTLLSRASNETCKRNSRCFSHTDDWRVFWYEDMDLKGYSTSRDVLTKTLSLTTYFWHW